MVEDMEKYPSHYDEEIDPYFCKPCSTCSHRHKQLNEGECPCLKCRHYYGFDCS